MPRAGQLIMIAGRSGSQKSGFALFWAVKMALPTLYVSADMSAFTATSRLVGMKTGETQAEIEAGLTGPDRPRYLNELSDINIQFSFGQPIRWSKLEMELDAYAEVHNAYPQVLVIDNLMDIEGCEDEYQAQMNAMQILAGFAREYGMTVIVIHHATDKSGSAELQPGHPPSRKEIKNGLAEKPELVLTVGLEPNTGEFKIACVKQREGPANPAGKTYARLQAYPEITRFGPLGATGWDQYHDWE